MLNAPTTTTKGRKNSQENKRLHPVSTLKDHPWNETTPEGKGIQWSYNSCYVDVVIVSLFGFQDSLDQQVLLDDMRKQSTSTNGSTVALQDIQQSQYLLRKVVNVFRRYGYVKSRTVRTLREHLACNCKCRVAFPHSLGIKQYYIRTTETGVLEPIDAYRYSRVVAENSRIEKSCLPPKYIYSFKQPYHNGLAQDIIVMPQFIAHMGDASEFLLRLLELFKIQPDISLCTHHEDKHHVTQNHILLLSLPDNTADVTIQQLLSDEYQTCGGCQLGDMRDCIKNIKGDTLFVLFKRMDHLRPDEVKTTPVGVDFQLSLINEKWQLQSVIVQKNNHNVAFCYYELEDKWFYFDDKYTESGGTWIPTVKRLSKGFAWKGGFSKISKEEYEFQSLMATNGFLFMYKKIIS